MEGWEAAQIVLNIKTPHEKEAIFSGSDHISAIWKYLYSIANLYFSNIRTAGGKLITYILYFRRNNLVFSRPFLQKISLKSNLVTHFPSSIGPVVIVMFENVRKLTKPDDWVCQETHESFPPEHLPMSQSASARPQKTWKNVKRSTSSELVLKTQWQF